MELRLFSVLAVIIFLAGCSTVQKPSPVTELQIKVSQLENKIEEKDQAISDLRDQVDALSSQVENAEAPSSESLSSADNDSELSPFIVSSGSSSNHGDIIRVGINVEALQKALKNAGYYEGSVDGKLGKKTKQGIEQFQKDHGLKADGIVGKQTWAELKNYTKE